MWSGRSLLFCSFLCYQLSTGLAQVPTAQFTLPVNVCLQQFIEVNNQSVNADSYLWDFCLEDFKHLVDNSVLPAVGGMSGGAGYKLVEDQAGTWFGFVTGQYSYTVHRLNFGTSPLNTPTITSLGNPGNMLDQPQGIDIVNQDGNWFGFIGSTQADAGIVKLNFGTSITNVPTVSNLGTFGIAGGRFWDVRVIKQGTDWILVTVNRDANSIVRINFGNSFNNSVNLSTDVYETGAVPGANLPLGLDVIHTGTKWVVILPSYYANSIQQISFGNDILSGFTSEAIYSFSSLSRPYNLRIVREGNLFIAFVNNESSGISVIDLKDLNTANPPEEVSLAALPVFRGSSVVRWQGNTILQGTDNTASSTRRLVFHNDCGAAFELANQREPQGLFYTQAGIKRVELISTNIASGEKSYTMQQIIASSSVAPDINFISQNICANSNINFTSQNTSGNITGYSWDFGDTNTSTQPNPSHIYATAGTYPIELQVTASNGCTNFSKSDLAVYNQPISDFSLPSTPSPICSNQLYFYTNTSVFDPASNPTWEWSLDGNPVSMTTNLSQTFSSTANQVIKLKASIPGCSNESTQTINGIQAGALVDFSASTGCQGSALQFTNNTFGSDLIYLWDFGDGNSSLADNPANIYSTFGNFNATLHADNGVCNNSATKPITIYSKPQANFSLDLPPFSCQGTPSQFNDLTPNPTDSNLSSWSWNFGDAPNGTSGQRNPLYTYSAAGPYNVSLDVTTNFGCGASVQKMVTITPAPPINFNNTPACINQPAQFTDTSGAGVKSWLWKIDNNTYIISNPVHTFTTSGPHNVELTITGANDCIAQMIKTVMVPAAISPDFSVENACSGKPSTFLDLTAGGTDPVVTRNWNFAGLGSATGASPQYAFATGGNYSVKLNTTHQSGCVYLGTKTISIGNSPKSLFASSTEGGPPPLVVKFSNSSTDASSYLWKFNDKANTTSLQVEPSFTFNELGDYQVELTSFGQQGCADTFSKPIRIVEPKTDLSLTGFELLSDPNSGSLRPLVTIKNNGNIAVANVSILIDLSGGGSIKEKMQINLQPNQSFTQALVSELLPMGLNYVCAQINLEKDENLFDNKRCSSLDEEVILFAPYPNPSQGELHLDWIAASGDVANIVIFNSTGANAYDKKITAMQPGLSQIILDISTLGPGIYFVVFSYLGFTKTHRFMVN